MRILLLIFFANLIGAVILALLSGEAGIFDPKTLALVLEKADHKVRLPIGKLLASSILCNIIVSTGVCLAGDYGIYSQRNGACGSKYVLSLRSLF